MPGIIIPDPKGGLVGIHAQDIVGNWYPLRVGTNNALTVEVINSPLVVRPEQTDTRKLVAPVYWWDGAGWVKALCNTLGYLLVEVDNLNDPHNVNIQSQSVNLAVDSNIQDVLVGKVLDTYATRGVYSYTTTGAKTETLWTVPAGEKWFVELLNVRWGGASVSYLHLYLYRGASVNDLLYITSPTEGKTHEVPQQFTVIGGDEIRVVTNVATANVTTVTTILARRIA